MFRDKMEIKLFFKRAFHEFLWTIHSSNIEKIYFDDQSIWLIYKPIRLLLWIIRSQNHAVMLISSKYEKFTKKKISNRLSMQTGAVQQNETNLHNKCILKN